MLGAESPAERGAAHLLATAAFTAGTKRLSGLRLMRDLELLGAVVDCKGDREKICYEVQCPADKVESVAMLVSHAILTPPEATYRVDDEKVIAQIAIDAHHSDPFQKLDDLLHEAAYGENSALGAQRFNEDLLHLEAKDVFRFRDRNFHAKNLVVTANGLSHESLRLLVETYLQDLPDAAAASSSSAWVGGQAKERVDLEHGNTYLGWAVPTPAGADAAPFEVLHALLNSKIAAASEAKNLSSFYRQYTSGGMIGFRAHGSADVATKSLSAGVAILNSIAKDGAGEVGGAKTKIALENALALEGRGGRSTNNTLLSMVTASNGKYVGDVRSVTGAQVSEALSKALKAKPAYAIFGTTLGVPSSI